MRNTITATEAEQRVADYAQQVLASLPPGGRPEMSFKQTSQCDDPTDAGPRGRVFASIVYQIHDVPVGNVGSFFDAAHKWWTDHGFRVYNNWKPGEKDLSVENTTDSFRMGLSDNDAGLLILATDSPCVWPNGTPEPKP